MQTEVQIFNNDKVSYSLRWQSKNLGGSSNDRVGNLGGNSFAEVTCFLDFGEHSLSKSRRWGAYSQKQWVVKTWIGSEFAKMHLASLARKKS